MRSDAADQVDPEVAEPVGARAGEAPDQATATAMPTAAETKFCTASPAIWTRWPIVDSPEYDCQFVLVTNEAAVLNAWSGVDAGEARGSAAGAAGPAGARTAPSDRRRARRRARRSVDRPALVGLRVDAR